MSFSKNDTIELTIESLSNDGSGVGHYEGMAVFVPSSAPGDVLRVKVIKKNKTYAIGRIDAVIAPAECRIVSDCPISERCGGCCFRHISYETELREKEKFVSDAFRRLGGIAYPVDSIVCAPSRTGYRNKAQFPLGPDKDGKIITGFFAKHSHRIVPCCDCKLLPDVFNQIAECLCELFNKYSLTTYDETTHRGLLRHIFLRKGNASGEIMLCLIAAKLKIPHEAEIAEQIRTKFPEVKTMLIMKNADDTNVILGEAVRTVFGSGFITDTMCGVPVQIGPYSFYQVNTPAAEKLYRLAAEKAALTGTETVLDLYCGMGTIGLSMVHICRRLIGVEIVPEAVEAARVNAEKMGKDIAEKCRFICGDAGQAAQQLASERLSPDIIVVDPPRKGCDEATRSAVLQMSPQKIVMISCNPATAARDAAEFVQNGYAVCGISPVDLFPGTNHVETIVLFRKV